MNKYEGHDTQTYYPDGPSAWPPIEPFKTEPQIHLLTPKQRKAILESVAVIQTIMSSI
jgi:hypothetical protein